MRYLVNVNYKCIIQNKSNQMQKKKGKRINFKIVHCSSEDPEYPATELLLQSPDAKGWQNKRFSAYPQTIVIELVETSLINKIAILSHQSKIASKIEFETKVSQSDEWKKLGRISLDSNSNTNYQAREFKQANINDVQAKFLRLILRQNHVNGQNLFNQIGLISISFYGVRREDLPPVQQRFAATKSSNEIDQGTMNRIKELQAEKKRAVEHENYDLAKEIKDEIDRLKKISAQIIGLEERKQEAIRRENYEDAKIINEEIKRLRQGGQAQPEPQPHKEVKQPPYRPEPRKQQQEEDQMSSVSPITNNRNTGNVRSPPQPLQEKPRPEKKEVYEPPQRGVPKREDDDERPLNVKNSNPYEEPNEQPVQTQKETQLQALNKELFDECSEYFSVLDEEIFRHLFSKDHANRQKGVEMVLAELKSKKSKQDLIGACLYVIKNLIDDKIASVLIAVITLMSEMMKKLKPQPNSYYQPLVDYILEKMGDYLGHINQKIKNITEDTFGNFPMYHLTNKDVCYRALSNIGKRDKAPKILVGRLKMLNKIVRENQLGNEFENVIKYAVKYADDKNNDVRVAAIALICSIASEIGYNAIQPYLKNLRPPIIKSIQEKMEEAGTMQQPQNFDEKPIKTKAPEKSQARSRQQQQQLDVGNEFIEIPKKGGASKNQNHVNEDEICEFCKRVDKRFVEEDYKDMHYFNACPMLIICSECGQGIQINTLTSHLVGECANSKYYKKCPRCKEAVHQKSYKAHVQKKECLPAKPLAAANRCPLCHLDINPGANGWKQHLVDEGCENNPRA